MHTQMSVQSVNIFSFQSVFINMHMMILNPQQKYTYMHTRHPIPYIPYINQPLKQTDKSRRCNKQHESSTHLPPALIRGIWWVFNQADGLCRVFSGNPTPLEDLMEHKDGRGKSLSLRIKSRLFDENPGRVCFFLAGRIEC